MSAIKNFFQKRKIDKKFKQAGEGHKLNEASAIGSQHGPNKTKNEGRPSTTDGRKQNESTARAASAALARFDAQSKPATKSKPVSATTTWKHSSSSHEGHFSDMQQLKREMKNEMKLERAQALEKSPLSQKSKDLSFEGPPVLSNISFACPICPASLPECEMRNHIESCLYKEIDSEPGMITATMMHTLNSTDKVRVCIETLNKYIDNILKSPSDEKYRKIKQSNKVFKERVAALKGVKELLTMAIGFVDVKLPIADDENEKEDFYVLSEGLAMETEKLSVIRSYLNEAEPLLPILDRNTKVFEPVPGYRSLDIPSDFYQLSGQEIKREQEAKTESMEKSKQLRTKSMKSDSQNQKRAYRFSLIRVRFPDGNILEGTFYSKDKLSDVFCFVKEALEYDWLPFTLSDASGKRLTKEEESLETLQLSPAAILNFNWEQGIAEDLQASNVNINQYLTNELLARRMTLP